MSTHLQFRYNPSGEDPRYKQLLKATEKPAKTCQIHIDEVKKGNETAHLNTGQFQLIKNVFNKEIHLSRDTDHHIKVAILGDSKFSITIDGESKFFITRHGADEDFPVVAIQERIKERTFMTSVREFFQTIANFFYTPTYPTPELKARKGKEAILQDYRGFRKALQEGKSWLRSKDDIRLTSPQQKERDHMNREIDDLIRNAKKIEKALDSRNQAGAFDQLADEFSGKIFSQLEKGGALVIPVGYLNSDNVLQPVMMRFERNADGKIILEIYADSAEGKGNVPPLHKREFNKKETQLEIKNVLNAAFQPMVTPKSKTSALKKAAKQSEFFSARHREEVNEILEKERSRTPKSDREDKTKKTDADPGDRFVSLTFEGFMRDIDKKMEGYWSEVPIDQAAVAQASSPSERIVGWFNHLIRDDKNKLTTNEKLNLMFFITEDYAQDQLRQVRGKRKKVSLEKQLEVYKRVGGQIAHMRENIAVSLNNGHPLDTDGIPESLKKTEALCNRKIEQIERKLRQKKMVGASRELTRTQSAQLGFNVGATRVALPVEPTVSLEQAEGVLRVDEVSWRKTWLKGVSDVRDLFSKENVYENRACQIATELYAHADRRAAQLSVERDVVARLSLTSKEYDGFDAEQRLAFLESLLASSIPLKEDDKLTLQSAVNEAKKDEADKDSIFNAQEVKAAIATVADIAETQTDQISKKVDALNNINLQELVVNEEVQEKKLVEVIAAIVDCFDERGLQVLVDEPVQLQKEQLVILLKQMVLDPHELPVFMKSKKHNVALAFEEILLAIDPQGVDGSKLSVVANDLRAIVNLRMLLPKQNLAEKANDRWSERRDLYKARNLQIIDGVLKEAIEGMEESIEKEEADIQKYTELEQMPGALEKEGGAAAAGITETNETDVSKIKMRVLEEVLKADAGERNDTLREQIKALESTIEGVQGDDEKVKNTRLAIEELKTGFFDREIDYVGQTKTKKEVAKDAHEKQIAIYEEAAEKETLDAKQKFFQTTLEELRDQHEVESKDEGDKRQAKVLDRVIKDIEKDFKFDRWKPTLGNMKAMIRMNNFLDGQDKLPEVFDFITEAEVPAPQPASLSKGQSRTTLTASNQTLTEKVSEMTQALEELSIAAASEADPAKKKAMYEEIKTRSMELLSLLPPPGTEGASGNPSIWSALTHEQSKKMRASLQRLQHHVWEAQMRLSKNEMTGKEKFMMIKAQAINMALVRTEVSRQRNDLEAILTDIYQRDPHALDAILKNDAISITSSGRVVIDLENLHPGYRDPIMLTIMSVAAKYKQDSEQIRRILLEDQPDTPPENGALIEETLKNILILTGEASFEKDGLDWDADTPTLTIDWDKAVLDWTNLKSYFEDHTQLLEDHSKLNPRILCLDLFTLDTMGINQVLSQDLTTCLAQDARLDQEVQAVYHFVLADQSRGKHKELQPEVDLKGEEGRSPLMYPSWKHGVPAVHNPYSQRLETMSILRSLEASQKRDLAIELYSKKEPDDEACKQALTDIFSELNPDQSFTSKSEAIKWNHETQSLEIKWDAKDLEWDQLLEILARSDQKIQSALELIQNTDQTAMGHLYYATAADPDFTLYQKQYQPPSGLSFFQKNPDLLLNQRKPLELVRVRPGEIQIRAGDTTPLADVHLFGKEREADQSSFGVSSQQGITEEQVPLLMRPKVPFLPTVEQNISASLVAGFETDSGMKGLEDIRQSHTYDVWKEYVLEVAGEDVLSIPPNVLLQLFLIREAPDDKRNGELVTSYTASTAINALEFLTDRRNQTYLKNDFVQQYILESLFGPMVMQQALLDHPENVLGNIEQLKMVLEQAQTSHNPELVGFYTTVLKNLGEHITVAQQQIREHGLFAGSLTNLPVFRGKTLGVLYRPVTNVIDRLDKKTNPFFIGRENLDQDSILHPLAPIWMQLEFCAMEISTILENLDKPDVSVKTILMGTGEDTPPIDEIKNPQAKRQAYLHLLQEYRTHDPQNLKIEDWQQILTGYESLISGDQEGGIPQLQSEVVSWVKREVLPVIQSLDSTERDKIIKQLINQKLVAEGQSALKETRGKQFSPVEGKMNLYEYSKADGSTITIDLMTMSITGVDLTKRSRSPVPVPKAIMNRADVQQALHTPVVHAMMTQKGEKTTYTWSHEGQNFSMVIEGSAVTIERTISDDHPTLAGGTYRFTPIHPDKTENHAAKLLGNNGIWMKENALTVGWIFSSGIDVPSTDSLYYAQIDDSNTIQDVRTLTGALVSTSTRFEAPSPVLFATTENTVVLLDAQTKKPSELRLPQFNVSMIKTSDNKWKLSQQGKTLGTIKATDQKEERFLKDQFGPHWDQFVIPLKTDDGKTVYFMIPYVQRVDKKGRISVDQSTMGDIPHPVLMTLGSDGNLRGSQASELYLAYRYLLQAEKTKNPTMEREYFQKAQQRLDHIGNTPLPGTPEEVENLKYVMQLVADHPAISLKPAPTPTGLAITIKMELFVQKVREKAKAEGVKSLQIGSEQELTELSKIAKYYEAYSIQQKKSGDTSLISPQLFALTNEDLAALGSISQRLLIDISKKIGKATTETYFGTPGRLSTKITMEKPTELDPQLILALVRMAKPVNPEISLKGISAPLPLGHFMENFWSYLVSIKNEGLTPEDLIFLFDESIIPPADSPEQEEQLRALDLHARQFLIGMASIMKEAGGKVDPMAETKEAVADAKQKVKELTKGGIFQSFVSQFKGNPDIETNLDKIIDTVEEIQVKPIPDSDPETPDVIALGRDLAKLKTHVENFKGALQETLTAATKLIESTNDQYQDLTSGLVSARKELKSIMSDKQSAIKEIEEEYSDKAIEKRINDVNQKGLKEIEQFEAQIAVIKESAQGELKEKEAEIDRKIEEAMQGKDESMREELSEPLKEQLQQFTEELKARTKEQITGINRQINEVEESVDGKVEEIRQRYSPQKRAESIAVVEQDFASKIEELEKEIESKKDQFQKFNETKVLDPVSGVTVSNSEIIEGGYADTIRIDELKDSVTETGKMVQELDSQLDTIKDKAQLLDQWQELQKHIKDIQSVSVPPSSWFSFPDKGAGRDFLEYQLKKERTQKEGESPLAPPPSPLRVGLSFVGQLGVVDTVRLAKAQSQHSSLTDRLNEISEELLGIDEKLESADQVKAAQLREEKNGLLREQKQKQNQILQNPFEVTRAASEALAAVLLASECLPESQFECQPEDVADRTDSTRQGKASEVLDWDLAEQCFTSEQLETLNENLHGLSQDEQLSYVQQLSQALKMNASIVEAQAGLRGNMEIISSAHSSRISSLGKKASTPTHDFSGEVEGKSRKERYQGFFQGKAEFPDRQKASEIFNALPEKASRGSGLATLRYLQLMIPELMVSQEFDDPKANIQKIFGKFRRNFEPIPEDIEPYLEAFEFLANAYSPKYQGRPPEDGEAYDGTGIQYDSHEETVIIVGPKDSKGNMTFPILAKLTEQLLGAETGEEFLLFIQDAYEQVAPIVRDIDHQHYVQALRDQTLPNDSLYAEDLNRGFEKLSKENPLAYTAVIGEDQVFEQKEIIAQLKERPLNQLPESVQKIRKEGGSDEELLKAAYIEYRNGNFETTLFDGELTRAIQVDVNELSNQIDKEGKEIIARLKAVPLDKLPKSLQKILMRSGNDTEFLLAAFKEYRNGSFSEDRFDAETLEEGQQNLDALIGKCLIDRTRKNVLQGARFNAATSAENLGNLLVEKAVIKRRLRDINIEFAAKKLKLRNIQDKAQYKKVSREDIEALIPEDYQFGSKYQKEACILILLAKLNDRISGPEKAEAKAKGNVYEGDKQYKVVLSIRRQYGISGESLDAYVTKETFEAFETAINEVDSLQSEIDSLQSQLDAANATWKKESASLNDYTDRCQSSKHLTDLPSSLKPYARHINYLQEKMGLVLRDDQIKSLEEIVENPALLKQLRMGLGKTSIIVPFALMILGAKGHNAIGMVPKALFTTNFDEMDDTTRTVFELSGNQFLFSKQDASFPLNTASLHRLSAKCAGFFKALEQGEYVLTTIESKASLDNKISELERSQAMIQEQINLLKADEDGDHATEIDSHYKNLVNHQMALDMLYRVKDVFEADRTRLIIDEVDSVAKANYSVNSESGVKTPIEQNIQEVAVNIFDVIRKNDQMQAIFAKIKENNQFTLDEKEVNTAIKAIGEILIKEDPELEGKKEEILEWFAGERECPYDRSELRELGHLKNKLMIMRKALNSGLRSSLGLKAGLSCDFDPTHGAIGVPASQGVTSKTTKYSDPLMQVILTQMIALYKPQGEAFLRATSLEVIDEMKKEIQTIDSILAYPGKGEDEIRPLIEEREELRAGIFKLNKLVNPQGFLKELQAELIAVKAQIEKESTPKLVQQNDSLEEEIQQLNAYIQEITDKSPPVLEQEIDGDDPVDVFLRQRFAQQVAKRGMIYVSTTEMSRPVQHALRGCNVIGLTGTATRNTEHVITSTGHKEALDGVTKAGRETTAEVVYRFVKALTKEGESPEEALKTPVKTYSLDSETAFQNFVNLAKKGSGYRFIVNQAGSCDQMSLREIARGLHEQAKRPIVYLDMDEDGRTEKVALINGQRKPLSRLSETEEALIKEEGFFYYHTPHVRGTDFRIPPGSRGALMMSPKVNANDRDQAIYRARSLGEGHIVEPFVSEKQAAEFKADNDGDAMTVGDMLKIQHEQTREDEGQEDLSAYTLHIKGMVTFAADQAKKEIQLQTSRAKHVGDWMRADDREGNLKEIEAKVEAFQILEKMFTKDTGNEAYLRQLESEMREGGMINTKDYLCEVVIPGERARIERYLDQLDGIKTDEKPELKQAIEIVSSKLDEADKKLEAEAARIEKDWATTLEKQLPKKTLSSSATQETSETEAEAEAEAVAETTSETESETAQRRRAKQTRGILMEPDLELLRGLRSNAASVTKPYDLEYLSIDNYHEARSSESYKDSYTPSLWKDDVVITPRLKHILAEGTLGQPPQIKAVVLETHKGPVIILTDAADANQLTGHFSVLTQTHQTGEFESATHLTTGYTVTPTPDEDGKIKLKYGDTGTCGQSRRGEFDYKSEIKGNIYFSLLLVGYTLISDDGWHDMGKAWEAMDEKERGKLKAALEEKLSSASLQKAALHLWNKPVEKAISLGDSKVVQDEDEKPSTVEGAKEMLIDILRGIENDRERKSKAIEWAFAGVERGIRNDMSNLVDRVNDWSVDPNRLFDDKNLK